MLALIPHTSALLPHSLEATPTTRCHAGAQRAAAHTGSSYTEIEETQALLADLLGARPAEPTERFEAVEPVAPEPTLSMRDGRWATAPWQDAIVVGDEALLLVNGVPMRLGGIGLTIWRAIAEDVAPDDLTTYVTDVHGAHPDADLLVAFARADLLEAGAVFQRSPKTVTQVLAGESRDDPSPPTPRPASSDM